MTTLDELLRISLFKGLSDEALRQVARQDLEKVVRAGGVVINTYAPNALFAESALGRDLRMEAGA